MSVWRRQDEARGVRLKPIAQQTVVITGASSGIGLATAREFAAAGAKLVLAARSADALARVAAEINGDGGTAVYVVADVGQEGDVRRIGEVAVERFGGFDTWFNNAGVTIFGKTEDVSLADHRRLFETNYWGTVHGALVALPQLRQHGGALINMGSMLSDRAMPLQGPYSASKHAVKGLVDALRMEVERDGAPVSITLLKPMTVATPLQEHAVNYLPHKPVLPPPAYEPRLVAWAVRYAAEHPVRELAIGELGPLLGIAGSVAPELMDRLMAANLFDLQQSDEPASGQHPNLHAPSTAGRERDPHRTAIPDSLYTRLYTNPVLRTSAALGTALPAGMLVLGSRSARAAAGWLTRRR